MTPGEMLAKKLRGDSSISNDDIEKATVEFFTAAGCNCTMGKHSSASIRAAAQNNVKGDLQQHTTAPAQH